MGHCEWWTDVARRTKKTDKEQFTKAVIEGLWLFSIAVWTQRNANEHGKGYGVSLIEKERVAGQIEQVYENLREMINEKDLWLF